jgi:hypothetical protein
LAGDGIRKFEQELAQTKTCQHFAIDSDDEDAWQMFTGYV